MKRLYSLLFIISISVYFVFSAENLQMNINGTIREYLKFIPETQNEQHSPLTILLHPNGSKTSEFAEMCKVQILANTTGSIILVPQALDEQGSEVKSLISTFGSEYPGISNTAVWNAGVSIPLSSVVPSNLMAMVPLLYPNIAAANKIQFNKDVDDISFINQIINDTKETHDIDASQIYIIGASMGGAMTYRYAYSENSQVTAIAVICGFIGAEVDHNNALDIPVCIFHSIDDQIVPFEGGLFSTSIPELVSDIAEKNGCVQGNVSDIENIADDGISIQQTIYNCNIEQRVWFYQLTGAAHSDFLVSDYKTGPNDIDYEEEIWNFFTTKAGNNSEEISISGKTVFYPNPAKEYITFSTSGKFELKDITGKTVFQKQINKGETIRINNMPAGTYLIKINTGNETIFQKLIISK